MPSSTDNEERLQSGKAAKLHEVHLIPCNHATLQPCYFRTSLLITFLALLFCALVWQSGVARADDLAGDALPNTIPIVVINELHTKPDVKTEFVEFVELHNPGKAEVSLAGWALSGAIDYVFPNDATLAPLSFLLIAENPAALKEKFGVTALGPYAGRLDADGDEVLLRDSRAVLIDRVQFSLGFPWPVVGEPPGPSLQLIHPMLDNSLAGHWRSAVPTPGWQNAIYNENTPPRIDAVSHTPQSPRSWQSVVVTATIADADGFAYVTLLYQAVAPGAYIALHDPEYQTQWTAIPMQETAKGVFRAEVPAAVQQSRTLVRYRIEAVDRLNQRVLAPYADDPQPNFTYFVYDGTPTWTASFNGGVPSRVTYDFNQMRPLPIYQLLAKKSDVADALFMPDSPLPEGYRGNDYLWRATLVYNGEVYDHIRFRARGGETRYATGKNMWKFNFNPAHRFQAYDNWGRPYETRWDKLNLGTALQQSHRKRRGEQGMFESITFRMFNLAGVEAPHTHFIHLRVIDDASEQGADQFSSDFWGLYLAIEQPDGRMLEEHGLPDGNLYKIENYTGEKNNQGATAVSDMSDLVAFLGAPTYPGLDNSWWRSNLDLPRYYSYRSIIEAVHHYDIDQGKNLFYYLNPDTKQWSAHPWDVDLTWYDKLAGTGVEPLLAPVLGRPEFNLEYQNRLREVRDLLFNPDQLYAMLDEHANIIDTAANGATMVNADRAMWDFNPIYATRYVDPRRSKPGYFYKETPTKDFRGMVQLMKQWVIDRGAWIDTYLIADPDIPYTPGFFYDGAPGYPADRLRFIAGDFGDPQGPGDYAAMEWRIAEVSDPAAPSYNPAGPRHYEITALWESGEMRTFQRILTPPQGVMQPGHAYRVRMRTKDLSGRWSHWSQPIQLIVSAPAGALPTQIKLTEIMYNPLPEAHFAGDELEFVELQNTGDQPIDLANMRLGEGIQFTFPSGAVLGAGQFVVIAENRAAFERRYGFAPFAEYSKKLSNGGDAISLLDAYGRTIHRVAYDDEGPWPTDADGSGFSLVLVDRSANPATAGSWKPSSGVNGSPAAPDPLPVLINEVLAAPLAGQFSAIELHNPNAEQVAIGGWFISDAPGKPMKFRIPDGSTIAAEGYMVFYLYDFTRPSFDGRMELFPSGGEIVIFSASQDRLTGHRHAFRYGASEPGVSWGRHTTSTGREQMTLQAQTTLGAANAGPRVGPVVISEIGLRSALGGSQFFKLTNSSATTITLYTPAAWETHGGFFAFPPGTVLPPSGSVIVSGIDPHSFCLAGDAPPPLRVFGPFSRPLADAGQELSLWRPVEIGAGATMAQLADLVDFSVQAGLPDISAIQGASFQRKNLAAYGNDPANWRVAFFTGPTSGAGQTPNLCSFTVEIDALSNQATIRWTMHAEPGVARYVVQRSSDVSGADAVVIHPEGVAAHLDTSLQQTYSITDAGADLTQPVYYWLETVGAADERWQLGSTAPVHSFTHIFAPIIGNE